MGSEFYLDDPRAIYHLPEEAARRDTTRARILALLMDGRPHSNRELTKITPRYSARIKELRDSGVPILSWRDPEDGAIWWYQLTRRSGNISTQLHQISHAPTPESGAPELRSQPEPQPQPQHRPRAVWVRRDPILELVTPRCPFCGSVFSDVEEFILHLKTCPARGSKRAEVRVR